ncbi:MAG: glycoside hydrolase family 26 protein [Pseudobacter sp.]|uniref:glycoside hydrolase family 26 protein n=1 Tax=Pseudobacter sp. TaxID=2045420 RepID=UPI003F7EF935
MIKLFLSVLVGLGASNCNKSAATPSTPEVQLLNGTAVVVSSDPVAGTAFTGKMYISYSGGNGAAFEAGNEIPSSNVTGLKAVLQKGVLERGIGHLVYSIAGTPGAAGNARFDLTFGGKSVTASIKVAEQQTTTKMFWGFFDDSGTPMSFYDGFGKKPSTVMMFNLWNETGSRDFPIAFCNNADAAGYLPYITLEPMMGLAELTSGKYDSDIEKYAQSIAAFGKPILLRFAHEFNGDWYPWSIFNGTLVPSSTYVQAFRYVHDKMKAAGATNARWVWCPNNANGTNNPQTLDTYYPGDAYVDLIAMDGYNFGTSQSWSRWQSFSELFGNVYGWITSNHPDKPLFIGEMGSSSTGGDKAAWLNDMFYQLENNFTKVRFFVWFNINKETDWRFTDNTGNTDAFKAGLGNSRVLTDRTLGGIIK